MLFKEVSMRERELQWVKDHTDEVRRLQGKWIAVEADKLIAEGDTFEAVYEATKEKGIEIPFIFLVPPEDDEVLVGF